MSRGSLIRAGRSNGRALLQPVAIAVVLVLTVAACSSGGPDKVATAVVGEGEVVESANAAGRIEANATWPVKAPAAGEIAELFVSNGDQVEADQPILRIDSPQTEALVAQTTSAAAAISSLGGFDLGGLGDGFDLGLDLSFLDGFQDILGGLTAGLGPIREMLDKIGGLFGGDLFGGIDIGIFDRVGGSGGNTAVDKTGGGSGGSGGGGGGGGGLFGGGKSDTASDGIVLTGDESLDSVLDKIEALPGAKTAGFDFAGFRGIVGEARQTSGVIGRVRDRIDGIRDQFSQFGSAFDGLGGLFQTGGALTGLLDAFEGLGNLKLPDFGSLLDFQLPSLPDFSGLTGNLGGFVNELALNAQAQQDALLVRAPASGTIVFGAPAASGGGGGGIPGLDGLGIDISSFTGGLDLGGGGSSGGTNRLVVGSPIGSGSTIFTVYDQSSFRVAASFDESQVFKLSDGMPARVRIDQLGQTVDATLEYISPIGEGPEGAATYPADIVLELTPEEAETLRVGMTAQVEVILNTIGDGNVVREAAILRENGEAFVFVVEDGKAVKRKIEIIGSDGITAAVSGIEPGDRVILAPRTVEEGQDVTFDEGDR